MQDYAVLILSTARAVLHAAGDLSVAGVYGEVASSIKDRVEMVVGEGGWQCVVGRRGAFGSCLSPVSGHYIHFDLAQVTVLVFKAH